MVTNPLSARVGEPNIPGVTYIEWSPIIAGTILALAISLILVQFSGLFGLQMFHPSQSDDKTRWMLILTCIWLFWVQLLSSMAGGFIAGRLRAPIALPATESEVRDGAHGLLVWALGTVIAVAIAAIGAFWTSLTAMPSDAVEQHREIAEHLTKNAGIIFGFSVAAGSFVSAAASCYTAIQGGTHRDGHTYFHLLRRKH